MQAQSVEEVPRKMGGLWLDLDPEEPECGCLRLGKVKANGLNWKGPLSAYVFYDF